MFFVNRKLRSLRKQKNELSDLKREIETLKSKAEDTIKSLDTKMTAAYHSIYKSMFCEHCKKNIRLKETTKEGYTNGFVTGQPHKNAPHGVFHFSCWTEVKGKK